MQIYVFVIFEIQKFQQIENTTRYETMTFHVTVKWVNTLMQRCNEKFKYLPEE